MYACVSITELYISMCYC